MTRILLALLGATFVLAWAGTARPQDPGPAWSTVWWGPRDSPLECHEVRHATQVEARDRVAQHRADLRAESRDVGYRVQGGGVVGRRCPNYGCAGQCVFLDTVYTGQPGLFATMPGQAKQVSRAYSRDPSAAARIRAACPETTFSAWIDC